MNRHAIRVRHHSGQYFQTTRCPGAFRRKGLPESSLPASRFRSRGPDSLLPIIGFASGNLPFNDPVVSTSLGTCRVNPPITGLEQLGRSFNCNLGTIGFGNTVPVTVRVSRLADVAAGASQIQASFNCARRDPNHSRCHRMTPTGPTTTLTTPVFISR